MWWDQGVEFELHQWRDTGKANGGPDGLDLDRKDDEHFRNPILFSTDTDLTIEEVAITPDIVIAAGSNISISNYKLIGELTIQANGTKQSITLESTEGSVANGDWKFVNLKAVINGQNGTKLTSVCYDPKATITWRLELKDLKTRPDRPLGAVIQAGQTRNPTYVTFKKINTATTPGFRALESFLRWGCGYAAAGTPTEQAVVNAVWAAFSGRTLKDVENKPVVYYATWSVKSDNTNSVVNRSVVQSLLYDVNCVTLTMYMVSALRAQDLEYSENILQGIPPSVVSVVQTSNNTVITYPPNTEYELMFVKNWQSKAQNGKTKTLNGCDWTNKTGEDLYANNGGWDYTWVQEQVGKVRDQLPGQYNNNPLAVFVDHFMVQLKIGNDVTKLYDPSYGVIYANLADFESKSVAYFGLNEGVVIAIRENGVAAEMSQFVRSY